MNDGIIDVLDPAQLREMIENGPPVSLWDVRTTAEYESVRIAGTTNVPLDLFPEVNDTLREFSGGSAVLICRSGQRARLAYQRLRMAGVEKLYVLEGGLNAWEAAGYDLRRGKMKWELERQVRLVAGSLVWAGILGGVFLTPYLLWLAGFVGAGLTWSALTDTCGMAPLLSMLPYNSGAHCDAFSVHKALSGSGEFPDKTVAAGRVLPWQEVPRCR